MKPTAGRAVHYVSHGMPGGEYTRHCQAAIITAVVDKDSDCLALDIINPTGPVSNQHVCQDQSDHAGGTWHWPERES